MLPDIYKIRRQNARRLATEAGSSAAFARKIQREPTQVSRFIGKNPTVNIGDDLARHIEQCLGLPMAWLDQNRIDLEKKIEEGIGRVNAEQYTKEDSRPWVSETLPSYAKDRARTAPLYTIDQLNKGQTPSSVSPCPFEGGPNTYAFTVDGMANAPTPMHSAFGKSYPVGCIVFVDPDQADMVQNGDVVMARLKNGNAHCFRSLYRDAGPDMLMPLNSQFPPISQDFEIIGKIIGAIIP